MKKIWIDCRIFWPKATGIGRCTYNLVKELLKIDNNNQYYLFLSAENSKLIDDKKYPQVKKIIIDIPHYSFKEQYSFPFIIQKQNLDLMHFTHFNAPIFYRGKSIVTIHDLTLHFFPGQNKTSFIHKLAYKLTIKSITRHASQIIAVSGNTKKDLVRELGINPNKIQTIYESVQLEKFNSKVSAKEIKDLKEKAKIGDNDYLLYVGVFRNHKNIEGLISAFEILIKEKKLEKTILFLCGPQSADYQKLKDLVWKKWLHKNILFNKEWVTDKNLNILLKGAKAFVFPSFYEWFGLPPLEAMAVGTPVVSSNISSIPEICGDAALFFNPYSPLEMSEKIYQILTDNKLATNLTKKWTTRIKQFSWTKMAKETLELYELC